MTLALLQLPPQQSTIRKGRQVRRGTAAVGPESATESVPVLVPLADLQSPMALFDAFRPKWKHSDPDVRVAAAGELDDPMILRTMVIEDGHWLVRHRVFDILREKYPDQEMYTELARNSDDEEIRRKAIKRLLDESALGEIAKNDKYRYVRDAAEHRLEELRTNLWGEKSVASETPS